MERILLAIFIFRRVPAANTINAEPVKKPRYERSDFRRKLAEAYKSASESIAVIRPETRIPNLKVKRCHLPERTLATVGTTVALDPTHSSVSVEITISAPAPSSLSREPGARTG